MSSIVRYFTSRTPKTDNSSSSSEAVGGILHKADEVDASFNERLRSGSAPISDGSFIGIVRPEVPFKKCYEYYGSVGKVQNSVDSMVAKVISRGWYFESAESGQTFEPQIKALNKFETEKNLSLIFEYWVRDWHLCGNSLLDLRAWVPVQMSSIDGLTRSKYGLVEQYIFLYNGEPISLKPGDFLHTKWIDADRQAWAMGAFHAIFNDSWQDPDVKQVKSTAAIMRVMQQDVSKIHHKFASPRVIYGFENVNKEVFDRDIAPLIGRMKAGDRLSLSKLPTLVTETVDGTARFTDSIDLINAELQAGLQASTNPILTQPQPLGTSKVGNSQDDERALGVLEKIRRLMDSEIIPRVIGEQYRGRVIFKWGKQDDFSFIPQELQVWLEQGVISKSEVRNMLRQSLKLDDQAYAKDIAEQEAKQKEQFEQQAAMKEKQRSGSIARAPSDLATEAIVKAAEAVEQRANKTRKKAHGAKSATLLKKAIEYSDDQPRDEAGRFAEGDSDTVDDETIAHYKSKGAQVSDKGVIRVYHRTTPEAKEKILSSGVMSGKEDGLFFSSKKEGQNAGYGAGVVALDIPAARLQLDDEFDDELHFRLPTEKAGQKVDIRKYLAKD